MTSDGTTRRLRRTERREQILDAATRAFASEGGFTHTSLDDVAGLAGVTRMILYRHFDSKHDLYGAVIDRAAGQLHAVTVGDDGLSDASLPAMIDWAGQHPDAFRLLFRHATYEPEFRSSVRALRDGMAATVRPYLDESGTDPRWAGWAAQLAIAIVIESIMAWLDNGMPEPEQATDRILRVIDGAMTGIAPETPA